MTITYLGCYPPTILDQSIASASGTATIMGPSRCEQLCHDQETSLFKSHNVTVNFTYFYVHGGNQCQCAPAINSNVNKLNDNDCSDHNSLNVQLYSISSFVSPTTVTKPIITPPSPTSSHINSGHSTVSSNSNSSSSPSLSSSNEPSIDSFGLIIGLSVAVCILLILGIIYFFRHRRRVATIKSVTLSSIGQFIPPTTSHDYNPTTTISNPKLSKPSIQLGKNFIIPTKCPDISTTTQLPPLLSQSDPMTTTKLNDNNPKDIINHTIIDPSTLDSSYNTPAPIYSPSEQLLTNLPIVSDDEVLTRGVHVDLYRQYRVHRGYQPSLDDELTLIAGEYVIVKEVFDDGWILGRPIILSPHHQGIIEGVFPLIALIPEFDSTASTTITNTSSPLLPPPHIINPLLPQPVTQNLVVSLASPTCQPGSRLVRLPNEVNAISPPLPSSNLGTLSSSYISVSAFQERRSSLMVSTISGN